MADRTLVTSGNSNPHQISTTTENTTIKIYILNCFFFFFYSVSVAVITGGGGGGGTRIIF